MSRRLTTAGAVAAGLLLLAGCGDRPGYDDSVVESYLASSQAGTFGASGEVGNATCPRGLALRESMSLTCTLVVSGSKVPYRVHLTHVHAANMSITAAPAGVLLSATRLGDYVRSQLPKASAAAQVECGGAYVVARVGTTLPCTLTLGSQARPLKLKVLDGTGRVQVQS